MKFIEKYEKYILVGILLFAILIRLNSMFTALWVDEAISAVASEKIVESGVPRLDSGLLYDRALVYHYLEASTMFFGSNDFVIRIISLLFGIGTILLAYYIGREYSRFAGLLAALFTSVFYLQVSFSTDARMYQMFMFTFFFALYALYKAREEKKFLYYGLVSMFLAIDTQIAGLVLCPFFIVYIWKYLDKRWVVIPMLPLVWRFFSALSVSSGGNVSQSVNYAGSYLQAANDMYFLLVFALIGGYFAFRKNWLLTSLLVLPSVMLLMGVFNVNTFALRYAYFFSFVLVLYGSYLLAWLYDKYGNSMLVSIGLVLIIPSTLIYPITGVNVLSFNYNYNHYSQPTIDYREISSLEFNSPVIVYFSPSFEWYVRKPDWVLPFSLDGRGDDQVSLDGVDVYSGAPILDELPKGTYFVIKDKFSYPKLKPSQREFFDELIDGCDEVKYRDFSTFYCS